jgi:hypothetical protein
MKSVEHDLTNLTGVMEYYAGNGTEEGGGDDGQEDQTAR